MGDHDALFKRIFSVPANAAGELRSILPAELAAALDISRLELVPGAWVGNAMDTRYPDLVFRAPLLERGDHGEERHVYLHVPLYTLMEHQSRPHPRMPLRGLEYTLGIWQQLLRDEPSRKTLPPVITLVVHHGPGGWTAPRSLHDMVEGLDRFPALRPLVPNFQLIIDDLALADDEQLLARPLLSVPKVAVWLLRDGRQLEAVLTHIGAWKDELTRVVREAPDEAMLFLRYISLRATERSYQEFRRVILETIPAAEAPLATIADELKQLGRQEGRQEGAVDALRTVLALQIEQRFGPLDPTVQALIVAADIDALQRALSRVAVVSDLGAVFPPH